MTIKELADELGVEKYKIKYLCDQLPPNYTVKVDNRLILSEAAVDAIRRKISGGELVSDIPVTPYNKYDPTGWINSNNSEENSGKSGEKSANSEESSEESDFLRRKSEDEEKRRETKTAEETTLTIIDLYKSAIAANDYQIRALHEQLSAKDQQIKGLQEQLTAQAATFTRASEAAEQRLSEKDAQISTLATAVTDRDRDSDSATLAQLKAKDSQIERMQDTIDSLMRQLEESREQQEQPRRWWQWWKR